MMPMSTVLGLSAVLFAIGVFGFLSRRNVILMLVSVEIMLNAANLVFVAYAREFGTLDGQIMVFFVMTVAAAEVAVGLALIVAIFRSKASIDVDAVNLLKG